MKNLYAILAISVLCNIIVLGQKEPDDKGFKWDFKFSAGKSFVVPNTISNPELTSVFEFNRVITNHMKIGFCSSTARFHSNKSFYSLPYDYKVIISEISPIITYDLNKVFTIGGGPAFYYIELSSVYNKLGFIIKSTLKYPKTSRLFGLIEMQYRYMGKINEIVDINYNQSYTSYNINTSHFYLGIGIGLRI